MPHHRSKGISPGADHPGGGCRQPTQCRQDFTAPEEVCKPVRASLDWVASARLHCTAAWHCPVPACSRAQSSLHAPELSGYPDTALPAQAQGTEPQLLACRAQHCSECSGVLRQGFGMQEAQCSCPAPAELHPGAPRD